MDKEYKNIAVTYSVAYSKDMFLHKSKYVHLKKMQHFNIKLSDFCIKIIFKIIMVSLHKISFTM